MTNKRNRRAVPGVPVRLSLTSERYEICTSLFDAVFGSDDDTSSDMMPDDNSLQYLSPEDELLLGVMTDTASEGGYYVKPADPETLRATREGQESDTVQHMQFITEGEMTRAADREGETVAVSYDETAFSGMEGSRAILLFSTCDPGLIHLVRDGEVRTSMTFKAHHRVVCTYDTPYIALQIGIHSLTVDNRLLSDGVLILDYIIEICGGVAERCRMELRLL